MPGKFTDSELAMTEKISQGRFVVPIVSIVLQQTLSVDDFVLCESLDVSLTLNIQNKKVNGKINI